MKPHEIIDALAETIREAVAEAKVTHPDDVLSLALTTVESVYRFSNNLPHPHPLNDNV
jgi:hypothetical protein